LTNRSPFLIFLFLYLAFCLFTFRDYGITWDERDIYKEACDLADYFAHGPFDPPPALVSDPEHNYPYAALASVLNPGRAPSLFHLLNLLFVLPLYAVSYELLYRRYKRPWASLAGPLFLFLVLPFSGSAAGNPKDIPFAVLYFLALAAMGLLEEARTATRWRGIIIGALAGSAMASRVVGATLLPILVMFDISLYFSGNSLRSLKTHKFDQWLRRKSLDWALALMTGMGVLWSLWPYLHTQFLQHLVNIFWLGAQFPPRFTFLFMGGMVSSTGYPWYYLPVWMGLTVPVFILVLAGMAWVKLGRKPSDKPYWLMTTAFAIDMAAYLCLRPAVYDGMRHFLFLLPILSLLAAIGWMEWTAGKKWDARKKAVAAAVGLNAFIVVMHLVRLHPYEYLYFNELAGGVKGAYGRFETDYWAASLKEAVEWLRDHEATDPGRVYSVYAEGNPYQTVPFLSANMQPVPKEKAQYWILINRAGGKPAPADEAKVIHVIEREGAPLSFILKVR
jgi:hypothetical protein